MIATFIVARGMATADHIISELGGSAEIARRTGFPLTTIESWKAANFIPEWRRNAVLAVAKQKQKRLTLVDFPTPAERIARATTPRPQRGEAGR